MESLVNTLADNPLFSFIILLLAVLILPPIFEKIRLPGLVGLLVAGVVLGKDGLNLINPQSESIKLFSEIGKIYLMFVAGLEIDLAEFRKTRNRSLAFGIATFATPLLIGIVIGRWFDFSWNSSILIGSLFASHTLLGYPIIQKLGKVRNQAVVITIGATIFTDIGALLVLAICVSIHQGDFTPTSLVIQLVALALYSALVLFGLDWAGKQYFRKTGDEESNQFLFVLLAVFLASVGAQIINVDKIVGAFLAGLAVNDVVGRSPVEEKVEFVGSTLFIPFFFIGMGLLLDIPAFMETIQFYLPLVIAIVGGLVVAKFLAAMVIKFSYNYSLYEGLTMWALSLPQVAATLAAALVAFQAMNIQGEPLITKPVFNSVIVLMLVTSILGPVFTEKFARKLSVSTVVPEKESLVQDLSLELFKETNSFTVLVPVYNPKTERNLVEIAALLARHEAGTIVPLSITIAHSHLDDPELNHQLKKGQELIERALILSEEFNIEAKPVIRIDDDIAHGISRAAREQNANLIIMGWSPTTSLQARLFGNVIDSVFWSTHCPVAVTRLIKDATHITRILVPLKNITPQALRTVHFAYLFAETNYAQITLLHVCNRKTPKEEIKAFKQKLKQQLDKLSLQSNININIVPYDDVAQVIIRKAEQHDLVILRSMRRRTAGGLAVSDVTTKLLKKLTGSLILFGEPHSG